MFRLFPEYSLSVPFGVTYENIGTIQRRLAWPLHKDDTLFQSGSSTELNIYFFFFWPCQSATSVLPLPCTSMIHFFRVAVVRDSICIYSIFFSFPQPKNHYCEHTYNTPESARDLQLFFVRVIVATRHLLFFCSRIDTAILSLRLPFL
ncbi:hypothetical protein GYMLUDRAFT_214162 [Collybiopsis luxurians FD-317 M1]|nr:hypothetical protein GYMLUDRAFT_214162 [Collybiopsis luxurians FD-317 M1]